MAPKKLYVQCNPLLDISAKVDVTFLEQFHLKVGEIGLATEEQMSIYDALEKREDVAYIPGGAGLNSTRVFQWLAAAPGLASYVGCVGQDRHGEILQGAAEKDGVQMVLEHTDKGPTGTCAVAVVGKERTLLANLGAANLLSAEHMKSEAVATALRGAELFYLTGFTLTVDVAYVLQVAETARKQKGIFVLNLSAPFIIEFFTAQLNQVLPLVDILIGNEHEAAALAKTMNLEVKDTNDCSAIAVEAAKQLPYTGTVGRTVIITQGAAGTIIARAEAADAAPLVVVPKPVAAEKIVDTNGAGDSFVGGFLAGLSAGLGLQQCAEMGNTAAGVVIQYEGCTFPSARPDGWPLEVSAGASAPAGSAPNEKAENCC